MFLVTTADERFWNKSEPILFLGEWCRLYRRRAEWEPLQHEVLPYAWEDRDRFHEACDYAEQLHERYLDALTEGLDEHHGVAFSSRYWRIVLGVWLRAFVESMYDRYATLKMAAATGRVTNTWVCPATPRTPPAIPSFAFDEYNQYLYSRIIQELGEIPYEVKDIDPLAGKRPAVAAPRGGRVATLAREVVRHARKGLPMLIRQSVATGATGVYTHAVQNLARNRVVFVGTMYMSVAKQVRLQLALGQLPYLYHGWQPVDPSKRVEAAPDYEARGRLPLPEPRNEFERVLNAILPDQIPVIYLEDYARLRRAALRRTPKRPRVIVTAFSMNYRTSAELWMAEQVERYGSKLVLAQHGGGYGSARHLSIDNHFRKISDRYFTWGARFEDGSGEPLPGFRLLQTADDVPHTDPSGQILWLATTMPRYRIMFDSGIVGPPMLSYFAAQVRFARSVSAEAHRLLVWRYFNDLWDEPLRWGDADPELVLQHGLKNQLGRRSDFVDELRKSRLTVHTGNETTYLQTMAANIPTIVFWDPKYYEVRDPLVCSFERLKEIGIFHETAESAAAQVEAVFRDPLAWWRGNDVQAARQAFCEELAFTHSEWFERWRGALASLIAESEESHA